MLRRFTHDKERKEYSNEFVALLEENASCPGLHVLNMTVHPLRDHHHPDQVYSLYPAASRQTFFARTPLWILDGTGDRVALVREADIYPYFQLGHGITHLYVVEAATLEEAQNKILKWP